MIEKGKQRKRKAKRKEKGLPAGRGDFFFFLSNLKDLERRRRNILFTREASDTTYLPTYYCWRRELNLFFPIANKKKKSRRDTAGPPGGVPYLKLSPIHPIRFSPTGRYLPTYLPTKSTFPAIT